MPRSTHVPRFTSSAVAWRLGTTVALLLVMASLCVACGKKGPPLAPVVRTPAAVLDFTARRSGDTVYLRLTVPATNTDATSPADLSRVEIYAYTAMKEIEELEPRHMTLVAQVAVRKPPDPEELREAQENPSAAKKPRTERPPEPGVDQGTIVTVTDALTPESMKPTPLPRRLIPRPIVKPGAPSQGSKLEVPNVGPVLEARLRRFYLAYGVNRSGLRGAPSSRFAVAFDALPSPPGTPRFEVKDTTIAIAWDPPTGSAAAIDRPGTDPLLPVTTRGTLLPVLPAYNIYLVSKSAAPTPGAAAAPPPELPLPLNAKPLTTPSFVDTASEFGVERCYQVRTLNTAGATAQLAPTAATTTPTTTTPTTTPTAQAAPTTLASMPAVSESAPSAIACVTPADTIAPPAPTALAAVASSGAISLIWTGVDAPDLAGYLVLRGSAPDGPLAPLVDQPIRETTYRDATVKPGTGYVYAVVAVDNAKPPNQSPLSNKTLETAR